MGEFSYFDKVLEWERLFIGSEILGRVGFVRERIYWDCEELKILLFYICGFSKLRSFEEFWWISYLLELFDECTFLVFINKMF